VPCTDVHATFLAENLPSLPSSSVVNCSAVSAYPMCLCVEDIKTVHVHWVTVGYIPMVLRSYEAAATEKTSATKAELLQRSLFFIFGRCMEASHTGCTIKLADGTTLPVSPRLILYSCDYQEERNLLSLKQHGSKPDCTPCMADSSSFAGRAGINQKMRDVTEAVTAQLRCADIRAQSGNTAAVRGTEETMGVHCRVPALAGWAGLGSGHKHLYQVTGFDRLHVSCLLRLLFSSRSTMCPGQECRACMGMRLAAE